MIAAGVALAAIGFASNSGIFGSHTLVVSGAMLAGAGATLRLSLKPSATVEDGPRHQRSKLSRESCVQPRDLDEMKLVLQVAPRKFVPSRSMKTGRHASRSQKAWTCRGTSTSRSGSIEFRAASHRSSDAGMRLVGPVSPWTKRSDQGGSRSEDAGLSSHRTCAALDLEEVHVSRTVASGDRAKRASTDSRALGRAQPEGRARPDAPGCAKIR